MAETTPLAAQESNRFKTVNLSEPIQRGELMIEKIILRKPKAGELRGLNMQQLVSLDVATVLQLLPRISEPVLVQDECNALDPGDLTELAGAIRGFFMTAAERRMLEAMLAEQQPKT
ncbi:phage tail assembly protein [Porphyrobacter sp. YT40]|uniref:phage tail assembly protein n=1 Tax=Porphyrobacter sp. YT40 TaxID=2547601 RepID=UPI0011443454|nr:phage tail assembly protein [Porphyrobacter sp. YT40]QDH33990.1 phage tail assembly protein [Porphyrobacter sp. YT40]